MSPPEAAGPAGAGPAAAPGPAAAAPASGAPRLAFVVSHTHWDREWYLPFHRFRVRLLDIVGQVLDALERGGDFRHFLLDGQAIVLEDYLALRPGDEDRIRRHVQAGRLSIGPWYVLPDEFLISSEATVRNLLVGHQVCGRFGAVQKVGYMPDSFGHVAQVPQILQRAGIDSFIYTRGNGDELEELGYEFRWEAPDGSDVLAVNQHGGYDASAALGFESYWAAHTRRTPDLDRAVAQVRTLFARMARLSRGDIYLVNNGGDHLPPQQEFGAVLAALRRAFPGTEFRHTGLADYVAAVKAAGFATRRYRGELRWGRTQFILTGVWSARMYLKQRNDEAETLLERYLEPVSAYLHFCHGKPYPAGAAGYAWKLLLQNDPHDSICGCSTDEVHREMGPRFAGVIDTAEQVLTDQLVDLAPTVACEPAGDRATVLVVMNPLPEPRTEALERLVVLPPPGVDVARLELVDHAGRPAPFRVTRAEHVERFWGIDYRTHLFGEQQRAFFQSYREAFGPRILRGPRQRGTTDHFLEIQLLAQDLPALGHATYYLRERQTVDAPSLTADGRRLTADVRRLTADGACLENDLVRVRLAADGSFDLEHKATGRRYEGLNALEDVGDVGDEYDFAPCPSGETVTSVGAPGTVGVRDDGGFVGRLEAACVLRLPAGVAKDRRRRARRKVDCPVRVRVTLRHGSPLVEVETVVDNRAKDHRLRAVFPAGIAADTIVSDGHFYVNRRPLAQPEGRDWRQPPVGTHPQQEFSLLEDAHGGLAVLVRGLPEIAPVVLGAGHAGLALTLLRAVGWLSRDDLETRRRTNAGPTLATPDAQCLGEQRFRYAVLPYAGDFVSAGVKRWSERYRTPPLVVQGVEDQHLRGGASLLRRTGAATAVTAVKRHERRDTLVVRLYNLTPAPATETLVFGPRVRAAWRTDLLEERLADLPVGSGHQLQLPLGAHEIATLEVEFAS